ncbi:MAG: glutaredoxin family protein [Nitrospirae bacterium]|nr:glutaredoxin family protein [Nitrospirota bacterium]
MADEKKNVLFALSTCPACKKTKAMLDKNNIQYILTELDLIDIDSRDKLLVQVRKYNDRETFPTLVVRGGERVIIGYDENALKEVFGI